MNRSRQSAGLQSRPFDKASGLHAQPKEAKTHDRASACVRTHPHCEPTPTKPKHRSNRPQRTQATEMAPKPTRPQAFASHGPKLRTKIPGQDHRPSPHRLDHNLDATLRWGERLGMRFTSLSNRAAKISHLSSRAQLPLQHQPTPAVSYPFPVHFLWSDLCTRDFLY